jgi:hypothetical protein
MIDLSLVLAENSVRKIIFWEYSRATWQYDVMVAAILAFIFLTPRELFRDQPRPSSIVMLAGSEQGQMQFWIEPNLLEGLGENARLDQANQLLKTRTGKPQRVTRLEPIYDAEQEIRGFMAYATQ